MVILKFGKGGERGKLAAKWFNKIKK